MATNNDYETNKFETTTTTSRATNTNKPLYWIVGVVAVLLIIGVFAMKRHEERLSNGNDNSAVTETAPASTETVAPVDSNTSSSDAAVSASAPAPTDNMGAAAIDRNPGSGRPTDGTIQDNSDMPASGAVPPTTGKSYRDRTQPGTVRTGTQSEDGVTSDTAGER